MDIWYSPWKFGVFIPVLVFLYKEKSGNPGLRGKSLFRPEADVLEQLDIYIGVFLLRQ
jgi:hypothetical protein